MLVSLEERLHFVGHRSVGRLVEVEHEVTRVTLRVPRHTRDCPIIWRRSGEAFSPDISRFGSSAHWRRQNGVGTRPWVSAAHFPTVFVRSEHTAPYPLERTRRGQRG